MSLNPPPSDDPALDRVRRRLDRLELELTEARRVLAELETARRTPRTEVVAAPAVLVPHPAKLSESESVLDVAKKSAEPLRPPPLPRWMGVPPLMAFDPVRQGPSSAGRPASGESGGGLVSAAASARATANAAAIAEPAPLRVWLERLQLWPPSGDEGSAEARLGAWWATRIGALLAVIGVVFFGVYVSLHTPPWVKFCELLAVAVGVCGLGAWLERRLPAFGAVVLASGLALVFFTAYAGHTVPAVRVLETLAASLAWQGVTVAVIVAWALRRRSPLIATLAIGLGHVTALFSIQGGFDGLALGVAALLGVVAVGLRWLRGWESPSVVAMPAGYAVFAVGLLKSAPSGPEAWLPFQPWPFLVGLAALYFARDWRRAPVAAEEVTAGERWFQNAQASAAVLLGLATALGWYRHALGEFYLITAALLALAAWLRTRQVRGGDGVAAVLTAKAVAALTLGVIELADARSLALALLVQAWALAWCARRLASRVLAAGAGLAGGLAVYFFFKYGVPVAPLWSRSAAQTAGFLLGLVALAHEGGRWLLRSADARQTLNLAAAVLGASGFALAIPRWLPAGWAPALAAGAALALTGLAILRRARAAGWTAILLAVLAQIWLWLAAGAPDPARTLGWNALAVLLPTLLAGGWLGRREGAAWRAGGTCAWALAVLGAALVARALVPGPEGLVVLSGGALVLGLLTPALPRRHLPWLATLALALSGWFAVAMPFATTSRPTWAATVALLAWALPVGLRALPRCALVRRSEPLPETMERILVLVATVLSLRAIGLELRGEDALLAVAGLAAAAFGLALRPGVRSALGISWALWALSALACGWVRPLSLWSGAVALLAWAPVWLWLRVPERWKTELTGWRAFTPAVQTVLATAVGLGVVWGGLEGASELLGLGALSLVAALTYRPGRAPWARGAAVFSAGLLFLNALAWIVDGGARGDGFGLAVIGVVAALLAALPLWLDPARSRGGRVAGGGAALFLAFLVWSGQSAAFAPYATVAWGGSAISLFMVGLFWRIAPYRRLGLLGLALCVPRVFVVDLHSVLHRILAFIVLGLVILWVGFSYHRFRHLVSASDTSATPPPRP